MRFSTNIINFVFLVLNTQYLTELPQFTVHFFGPFFTIPVRYAEGSPLRRSAIPNICYLNSNPKP